MRKRIGLLTFDFDPPIGGQGRNFLTLYRILSERCPEYTFLPMGPRVKEDSLLPLFSNSPHLHLAYSLVLSLFPRSYWRRWRLNGLIINGGPGGIHLLKQLPIPTIVCANHTYTQQLRFMESQWWKKVFLPLERQGYRFRTHYSSISSTTARELGQEYGIQQEKISIIPTPIDTDLFTFCEGRQLPQVLFVGRLEKRKGVFDLVPLMKEIHARDPSLRLLIVGEGSLKETLLSEASLAGLTAVISVAGHVDDEKLVRLYQSSLVTVVPSIFEGLGMTSLESLACGTPVVGRRVPGLVDTVLEGRDGYLCDTISEMASRIVEIASNSHLRLSMGKAGREKIEENFSPQAIARQWKQLLDAVI